MTYGSDPEPTSGRRQVTLAVAFGIAALVTTYLPEPSQQAVASTLRGSVLRPFIGTQAYLTDARLRAQQVDVLRQQVDSLAATLSTQGALAHENRSLRSLLGLAERVGPSYAPASLLRPGTPGSESMFYVEVGAEQGVVVDAPVLDRHGLVGVIKFVEPRRSVGIDWTHPDFRASAMVQDGSAVGIVENRRGAFREADRLVLTGTAYNERFPLGTRILTSGLGGVIPRGIPIGRLGGIETEQGGWLRSYWLVPMVEPAAVTHVLVAIGAGEPEALGGVWPADSLAVDSAGGNPPG